MTAVPSGEEVLALLHKSVDEYRAKGDVMNAALTLGVARHIERLRAANKALVEALKIAAQYMRHRATKEELSMLINALKEKPQ